MPTNSIYWILETSTESLVQTCSTFDFPPFRNGAELLELLNGVYAAGDDRPFTVVFGLDISTVNLLRRLQAEFGLCSTSLDWTYVVVPDCDRQQYVKIAS